MLNYKKSFKYFFYLIIALLCIYYAFWSYTLIKVTNYISKYSNQKIDILSGNADFKYFITFNQVSMTGFPFKFAIKISNLVEESNSNKIIYNSPIIMGYDIMQSCIFLYFSGEIKALYKPLQSGFGSSINKKDFYINIKLPLKLQIINSILKENKDLFQIINFIQYFECYSNDVKIFDLVDNKKLYDADKEYFKFFMQNTKFYENLNDFLNNIPNKFDVIYDSKINYVDYSSKLTPENLMHGYFIPFKINGKTNISLLTNKKSIDELVNDFELKVLYSPNSGNNNYSYYHKHTSDSLSNSTEIKSSIRLYFNKGIFNKIFESIEYIANNTNYTNSNPKFHDIISYIMNKKNNFNFSVLEDKSYDFYIDTNFTANNNNLAIKLNDFSLFYNDNGIRMKSDSNITITDNIKWSSKGAIVLHSYQNILDHAIINANINTDYITKDKKALTDVIKNFLKTISNHPDSESKDLSFDYDINSTNFHNSTFGSVKITKLYPLYYLTLYQHGLIKGDIFNLNEYINNILPNLDKNKTEFLNKLIQEPKKIDKEIWQKLIK